MTAVLRRAPVLETPSQVQVYLQEQLGQSRPEPVRVSKLEVVWFLHVKFQNHFKANRYTNQCFLFSSSQVRNWWQWSSLAGVEPYGAFADRMNVQTPHSFSFMMKRDLNPENDSLCPGNLYDVVCVVKFFLSDKSNWQQPFVCMTPDRASRLPVLPTLPASRSSLADNDDKRKTLISLADCVEERLMMSLAANYIRTLLQSHTVAYQLNPAPWMEAVIPLSAISHNLSNQEYTHIPVSGWQMQVRFKWICGIFSQEDSKQNN